MSIFEFKNLEKLGKTVVAKSYFLGIFYRQNELVFLTKNACKDFGCFLKLVLKFLWITSVDNSKQTHFVAYPKNN